MSYLENLSTLDGLLGNIKLEPCYTADQRMDNGNKDFSVDEKMKQLSETTKIPKSEVEKLSPVPLKLPTYLPSGYTFSHDYGRDGVIAWDVEKKSVSLQKDGRFEYFAYFTKSEVAGSSGNSNPIIISYQYDPSFTYTNAVGISDVTNAETIDGYKTTESAQSIDAWIPMAKTGLLHIIVTSDSINREERIHILKSMLKQLPN
jgi:hypothetical protein